MIALLFYIGAAVCLFFLMFALARPQRAPVEGIAHQFVEARSSLQTLQQGLLPADLLKRIFDRRDLDYIDGQAAPEIRRLFLSQRKAISLMWVRRVRSEILKPDAFSPQPFSISHQYQPLDRDAPGSRFRGLVIRVPYSRNHLFLARSVCRAAFSAVGGLGGVSLVHRLREIPGLSQCSWR